MKWLIRGVLVVVLVAAAIFGFGFFAKTRERAHPEQFAGYAKLEIEVEHRPVPLPLHIWYPAEQGTGEIALIGQNALFFGEHVLSGARPLPGPRPLVLLSHGSGGNAPQLGWLATELARRGIVVVGTDHPGTRSRDSKPTETVKIWQRPADLVALLDHVLGTGPLGLRFDPKRIGVIGFSLGGPSALGLAGLRYDKQRFIDYCAEFAADWDCGWLNRNGVNFAAIDEARYEASAFDERIQAVAVVDPALVLAVDPASLAEVEVPVLALNQANQQLVPDAVYAQELAGDLPDGHYHWVPSSWHFSFLAECSLLGKVIIGLLSPEDICADVEGRSRADVHAEFRAEIGAFFAARFGL